MKSGVLAALLVVCCVTGMQGQQSIEKRDAAQEETGVGPAARADAAAIADAMGTAEHPGWYVEAQKTRDQRLAWWREARFGCFIHWGPYSVLGGEWEGKGNPGYSEHIMRVDKIPLKTYREQVAAKFHPDAFNAREWVDEIKRAGMSYIVITAKHHDGFAIWPSTTSAYNIKTVAGFQRDPLAELVAAARAAGLHVGFYYSHAFDWEDPDAPGNDWDYSNPGGDRKLFGGESWYVAHPEIIPKAEHYVDHKAIPQLQELITRYHPDILWFDTPGKLPFFLQAKVVKAVRKADPNVVINGRAAGNGRINLGDYLNTADRPAEIRPMAGDWEAIPTTNESYGYNRLDLSQKPVSYFIQLLAKAAAKGGNILLNIGPRGDGTIDPRDAAILDGIGAWMAVNKQSIRGTVRTPLQRQAWGESTVKATDPTVLYLHAVRWPDDGRIVVGGLANPVVSAELLAGAKPMKFVSVAGHDPVINVPQSAPDPVDAVIVVHTRGAVKAENDARLLQGGYPDYQLLAFDATATGHFTYGDGKKNRFYADGLEHAGNTLAWTLYTESPQEFEVKVCYSARGSHNATLVLSGETTKQAAAFSDTPAQFVMQTLSLGSVWLKPHSSTLRLSVEGSAEGVRVFDLWLTPKSATKH